MGVKTVCGFQAATGDPLVEPSDLSAHKRSRDEPLLQHNLLNLFALLIPEREDGRLVPTARVAEH